MTPQFVVKQPSILTSTVAKPVEMVRTIYASPPQKGNSEMINQSVMSFRPPTSPQMNSKVVVSTITSRLLQNDIVNNENFNQAIYSPQCMDTKPRS
jgi:hypothetical protein